MSTSKREKEVAKAMPEGLVLSWSIMGQWFVTFGSITGSILCGPKSSIEEIADWLLDTYQIRV